MVIYINHIFQKFRKINDLIKDTAFHDALSDSIDVDQDWASSIFLPTKRIFLSKT